MPCAFHAERPLFSFYSPPGCQFDVPEEDLIEVDDESWCPFHAPMAQKDGAPTEKAGWDEERVQTFNQRVLAFIESAAQEGKPADLTGAVFPGKADFSGKQFPAVCFYKVQFSGGARFSEAQFSGDADFSEARFSGGTDFREARFSGLAYFGEAQFSGGADFREARFSDEAWRWRAG
ncbi:MAG: pentapeptide repeat-containing protein [Candidatus Tectomicrobia bacterium]|uniref:Pentapeptide repeat-containing protein n=1 Tax=Tectimicrobiota bacterium TaxID=2528274 RepID=A0A932ZVL0_UNCTE|nr:pentapeptide repeat-containing protein [Candidatus Tectomicrobia bacterium]